MTKGDNGFHDRLSRIEAKNDMTHHSEPGGMQHRPETRKSPVIALVLVFALAFLVPAILGVLYVSASAPSHTKVSALPDQDG